MQRETVRASSQGDETFDRRRTFEARLAARSQRALKPRAQRLLWLLVGALGFLTRTSRTDDPTLEAGNPDIARILVVRVDLLGDVVLTLPVVRAMRRAYPNATIDMLVLRSTAPVLVAEPEIAHVLTFDPFFWRRPAALLQPTMWREVVGFLGALRAARYDVAISVAGDIGSILTRLSGARRRVGYDGESYPFLLTDRVPGARYRVAQHESLYGLGLARAAGGIVLPGDAQPRLHISAGAQASVDKMLAAARASVGARGPLIAIHAGARNGQAKRWPPAQIATLATQLVDELHALVVLTGAPNEAHLAAAVVTHCPRPLVNLTGQTTIPELVALLAASDVVVSGDSGPMHIACAVGTAVVALHGPTDPALSGPTAPDAIVLRQPLWCAPCYDASATAECRFGNPVCMKSLAPSAVLAAVRTQLRRRGVAMASLSGQQALQPRTTPAPTSSPR